MTINNFNLNYNVTGSERKRLVNAIAKHMDATPEYQGAPSFAYQVDYFTIDRNGTVSFDDRADSEVIEGLIEVLAEQGFEAEAAEQPDDEADVATPSTATEGLTITLPIASFSETSMTNLKDILASKGGLICKALGIENLPVDTSNECISFPWFPSELTAEEVKAYTHLITALCDMARNQKRVTAKEKETDNDKYAFRCFLLRLGFIGAEFKDERKVLLRKLTGSSAFKSGAKKEVTA